MLTVAYYILKVIICSGILYGYYLIALRNKIFHRWNRFYLLSAIVLSLIVPVIKINIWQNAEQPATAIQLLQVVSTGDEIVFEYTKNNRGLQIDASNLSFFIYAIVSLVLLSFLIQTLVKINKLKKNNRQTIVEGVNFINTNADGTPFSFFNNIFWNDKIDINTSTGKQIFQHEVAHVQEKHSYDKIFTNIVLIFFWCNPFFWLIRKELNIIHEFIADKKAVEDNDTAAFAAMILQATYPQQQFTITNNFFYSPLKRRLLMLTKNNHSKINYLSRLLALPLAALVFFAFTLKMKTLKNENHLSATNISSDFAEPKQIATTKSEGKLSDTIPEKKMGKVTHIDFLKDGKSIILFEKGIVLNSWEYPVKNGYISQTEADKLINNLKNKNHPLVIVDGKIKSEYTEDNLTIFKMDGDDIKTLSSSEAIEKYGDKGKYGVIEIISKKQPSVVNDSIPQFYKGKKMKTAHGSKKLNKALIFYDDGSTDTISIAEAEKLRIIPPPPAMVIRDNDKVFTKVEVEPSFPGGDEAWTRYIQKVIQNNSSALLKDYTSGTCWVKFIVDENGYVSDVTTLNMKGSKLAEVAVNAIKKGPKWIPAKQNNHVVVAFKEQAVTFKIDDKPNVKNEPQ